MANHTEVPVKTEAISPTEKTRQIRAALLGIAPIASIFPLVSREKGREINLGRPLSLLQKDNK